jgi:hypothetical protein
MALISPPSNDGLTGVVVKYSTSHWLFVAVPELTVTVPKNPPLATCKVLEVFAVGIITAAGPSMLPEADPPEVEILFNNT